MSGRPRTAIGTFGSINISRRGRRYVAETRYRDIDGRLRKVQATHSSRHAASALLKERLKVRPGYGSDGLLRLSSPFSDLEELWLADLELREISESTKENYRDDLRMHVRPFFEHYTLGEITTGRVEVFIKGQAAISYSRAKHTRTLLNLLFGFALRHDAIGRNPVEGTSPLRKPKGTPQAMTLEQVMKIRAAAAEWRTGPEVMGPKPDNKVRDIIEVLLGTSMRPGEVLGLRPVDIEHRPRADGTRGMVVHVRGTVVYQTGKGWFRQEWPKTDASVRTLPVPRFAAAVIRARLKTMTPDQSERTIFHNRTGGPLSQNNVRRTFREFLALAELQDSGITPRWYRRTGATVLARGLGVDAAATHLGHTSTVVTEGHYIEPDRTIEFAAADVLERTLREVDPDGTLLARPDTADVQALLDVVDADEDDHVA
ncbi:hypothetical protein JCM18899A_52750 [Nocardioides sp. AN3]